MVFSSVVLSGLLFRVGGEGLFAERRVIVVLVETLLMGNGGFRFLQAHARAEVKVDEVDEVLLES